MPGQLFPSLGICVCFVAKLKSPPPSRHFSMKANTPKDLGTCLHVDVSRKPLQPLYAGPYGVSNRWEHFFRLDVQAKTFFRGDLICILELAGQESDFVAEARFQQGWGSVKALQCVCNLAKIHPSLAQLSNSEHTCLSNSTTSQDEGYEAG